MMMWQVPAWHLGGATWIRDTDWACTTIECHTCMVEVTMVVEIMGSSIVDWWLLVVTKVVTKSSGSSSTLGWRPGGYQSSGSCEEWSWKLPTLGIPRVRHGVCACVVIYTP